MSSQHRPYRPHHSSPSFKPPITNTTPSPQPTTAKSNEEEEDYMTMCIPTEIPNAPETSLQRTRRLKAAALARGAPPSAAEIAAEQSASRKRALETSLLERPEMKKSRGLAMMVKMGFDGGGGLGKKKGGGIREPIRVEVKKRRRGIGMVDEEKEKESNETKKAGEIDEARVAVDPLEYRDRVAKEREAERVERQVVAAQRLAQRLDEEKAERSGTPLPKKAPIVWRGLAKEEEKVKRHADMKRALAESLASMHGHNGGGLDDDDRMALGKSVTGLLPVAKEVDGDGDGDVDGVDAELQEFEGLKAVGRLNKVLVYLRSEHRYCMWCKSLYPDEDMEGCPGISEEEHD